MKKSKLFMATGAVILAATAVFATKANKRFTPTISDAIVGASGTFEVYAPSPIFTVAAAGNHRVFISICTVGGNKNVYAIKELNSSGSTPVFVTDTNF